MLKKYWITSRRKRCVQDEKTKMKYMSLFLIYDIFLSSPSLAIDTGDVLSYNSTLQLDFVVEKLIEGRDASKMKKPKWNIWVYF